jgi:hypothetical protein
MSDAARMLQAEGFRQFTSCGAVSRIESGKGWIGTTRTGILPDSNAAMASMSAACAEFLRRAATWEPWAMTARMEEAAAMRSCGSKGTVRRAGNGGGSSSSSSSSESSSSDKEPGGGGAAAAEVVVGVQLRA